MDRKHGLDAPNNETLKTVEQVDDQSHLSTMYPTKQADWTGEILTEEARAAKRDNELEQITTSIRKRFFTVGILNTAPIVLIASLGALAQEVMTADNYRTMIAPAVIAGIIVLLVGFFSYRNLANIFYSHALRLAPYFVTLSALLLLSLYAVIDLLQPLSLGWGAGSISLISLIVLALSVTLSAALLPVWTSSKINGKVKVLIICSIGALLGGLSAYAVLF